MKKIAIVGNIASGKSLVEKFLREEGYKTLDTDEITHSLLLNNNSVIQAFKDFDILEENQISRKKLGQIVFSNPKMKQVLENILHPQIKNEINKFFNLNQDEKAAFVSVPLLFEAGMENMFETIIFIEADDDLRLERLIKRNGFTPEDAKNRMYAQMPQEEKIKKSDYVLTNSSTMEELKKQVQNCLKIILSDS